MLYMYIPGSQVLVVLKDLFTQFVYQLVKTQVHLHMCIINYIHIYMYLEYSVNTPTHEYVFR